MDIINEIDDKTVFIMPHDVKLNLLRRNNRLLNIKSYTKDDLKRKILFDYDEQTIHYLINKYQLKPDVALMYLKNMYYVDDITYEADKLNKLVEMKNDLGNHHLLIKDRLFLDSLKDKKIIVYGYDYIDNFFQKLLNIIGKYATVDIRKKTYLKQQKLNIYGFYDIEDEVNFVAYSICKLIDEGIDINNIKLGNINDDYHYLLKRIFSFYNIPINLNDKINLYGTNIVLSFINLIKESHSFKDTLDRLSDLYDLNNQYNLNIYNKIVNICNNYLWYKEDTDDIIPMLINNFQKAYIMPSKQSNAIDIIDLKDNIIDDNIYLFIMNFNQGSMPLIYKNEDYITDDLCSVVGIESTPEKNMMEREVCKNIINRLEHPIITYKFKTKTSLYYPSSLVSDLDCTVIENPINNINVSYSTIQDKIILSKKLDKLVKYDELDKDIDILYHNYQDIPYKSYDNHFKGINNKILINYLSPKLRLSYSAIDNYFKCAFKYYINNVINLKNDEETFYLTIGKLFHYVLSFAFKHDFDFDQRWNEYLKDQKLNSKEQFFLKKLYSELKFIIETINDHNKLSTFDKSLYEEKIYVNKQNKIDVTFSGIVDKIMYREGNPTLASIIDYKTGSTDINLNNVIHGLNMQLPAYLYLVKNSHKFNDPVFVGFYLQEILHNEIYNDHEHDYETKKRDALKLKGYTIDQENLIEQFDSSYPDSRVIKSMKLTKNGFYAYSKILNNDQINNLINLVSNKIDEATANILDGKFDINPKRIDGVNVSCPYCAFRDMCYMKENDIVTLKEQKYSDFLGGEDHE